MAGKSGLKCTRWTLHHDYRSRFKKDYMVQTMVKKDGKEQARGRKLRWKEENQGGKKGEGHKMICQAFPTLNVIFLH